MGIFGNIGSLLTREREEVRQFNPLENPAVPLNEAAFLSTLPEFQDVPVTPDTIMKIPAFESGVTVIANALASAPLHIMDMTNPDQPQRVDDHPLAPLFMTKVNPLMTSGRFVEHMMRTVLAWGNSVWYIAKNTGGTPLELHPLYPQFLSIKAATDGSTIRYEYRQPNRPMIVYEPEEVLHLIGLSHNGYVGYSPAYQFADSFRLMLFTERFGRLFFQNNGRPSGFLSTDQKTTISERDTIKKSWQDGNSGGRALGTPVLSNGYAYVPISVSPDEAQFLESRAHAVHEVARILKIPVSKLQDNERSTYNNILEESIAFIRDGVQPWARWIEQTINLTLLPTTGKIKYGAKFQLDHLLARDQKTRYEAYSVGLQGQRFLTRDEVRRWEGLEALPDEEFEDPNQEQQEGQNPTAEKPDEKEEE